MIKVLYLLICFYIITGIYLNYKKYKKIKKEFEEEYIPKDLKLDDFKKRIEMNIIYEHKKENKKIFKMNISLDELLCRILYWPFL